RVAYRCAEVFAGALAAGERALHANRLGTHPGHVSESVHRPLTRRGRFHPLRDILGDAALEVIGDLVVDVAFGSARHQSSTQPAFRRTFIARHGRVLTPVSPARRAQRTPRSHSASSWLSRHAAALDRLP